MIGSDVNLALSYHPLEVWLEKGLYGPSPAVISKPLVIATQSTRWPTSPRGHPLEAMLAHRASNTTQHKICHTENHHEMDIHLTTVHMCWNPGSGT